MCAGHVIESTRTPGSWDDTSIHLERSGVHMVHPHWGSCEIPGKQGTEGTARNLKLNAGSDGVRLLQKIWGRCCWQ